MGMDLIPRRKDAESLHYNWSGWRALIDFLDDAGVATTEFDGVNDGKLIRADTCRAVADAIQKHADNYNAIYGGPGYGDNPADEHAAQWRASGGVRQF